MSLISIENVMNLNQFLCNQLVLCVLHLARNIFRNSLASLVLNINPCAAELFLLYFLSFEAGIAITIFSFNRQKKNLFFEDIHRYTMAELNYLTDYHKLYHPFQ